MQKHNRKIMAIAGLLAVAAVLVPPWHSHGRFGSFYNQGYHFIAMAPQTGEIDTLRLLVELGMIAGLAFAATRLLPRA